jgi:hypothetical protein
LACIRHFPEIPHVHRLDTPLFSFFGFIPFSIRDKRRPHRFRPRNSPSGNALINGSATVRSPLALRIGKPARLLVVVQGFYHGPWFVKGQYIDSVVFGIDMAKWSFDTNSSKGYLRQMENEFAIVSSSDT